MEKGKTSSDFDYLNMIKDLEEAKEQKEQNLADTSFNPDDVEYHEGDEAVQTISSKGFIKITDEELLIKILLADENNKSGIPYSEIKKTYDAMNKMGEKILIKVLEKINVSIPVYERQSIVNYALFKAIKDFNPKMNTSFSTFYYQKIMGEITSIHKKNVANNQGVFNSVGDNSDLTDKILVQVRENENGSTSKEAIVLSNDDPEEIVIEQDLRRRQLKAFRMAFAGIPRNQQILLYNFVNGISIKDLVPVLKYTEKELIILRDRAISLLLQRVIRSSHITNEEKLDILKIQGLADDEATSLEDVLEYTYRNIDETKNL